MKSMARKAEGSLGLPQASLLGQTKARLRRLGLWARKGLGQHFLIDREAMQMVVAAAELTFEDIVIEVGPGLGFMTTELARRAGRVVAVELDSRLADALKQYQANNITIINDDILHIEPAMLIGTSGYKVVANLPYYITSAVLRRFIEASDKPQLMVVMMQREVAQAIAAKVGRMSLLSVSVQLYGQPEIVGYVPAHSFYPPPEVDSAILRITLHDRPVISAENSEDFFKLVRAGFTASRKQLANSLAQGLKMLKSQVLSILKEAGIAHQRRAETLTLDEWSRLFQVYKRNRPC
jgi:16S rRNA (adenine1518-N6/adenine1519-N6)-dimethyltransferase